MRRIFAQLERRQTELGEAPYVQAVSTYTCATQAARERAVLFRGAPLFLGLSGDVGDTGRLSRRRSQRRADPGRARARWRAARVHRPMPAPRRPAGQRCGPGVGSGRFTCPYHGWTYDDHGRLTAQPCREAFRRAAARFALPDTAAGRRAPRLDLRAPAHRKRRSTSTTTLAAHRASSPRSASADYRPFARRAIRAR